MTVGSVVRRLLPAGAERLVADTYRDAFVDLGDLARSICSLDRFGSIIEVGCGEGALADRLVRESVATYTGIDIAQNPGRAYAGPAARAVFRTQRVEDLAGEGVVADVVILSDVIHHVPTGERVDFLRSCLRLVRPGGIIAVKEWEKRRNLAHALAFASDRYVSGDVGVSFLTRDELVALISSEAPDATLVCEARVPPRRNNLLLAFRIVPTAR